MKVDYCLDTSLYILGEFSCSRFFVIFKAGAFNKRTKPNVTTSKCLKKFGKGGKICSSS